MLKLNLTHHLPSSEKPEPIVPIIPGTFKRYSLSVPNASSSGMRFSLTNYLDLRKVPANYFVAHAASSLAARLAVTNLNIVASEAKADPDPSPGGQTSLLLDLHWAARVIL
jgi:hypothetical protein